MKMILPIAAMLILGTTAKNCSSEKKPGQEQFKGRLEIQGICMNYTIGLLEGRADTSIVTQEWTDDHTGKKYRNVFGLANPCQFPKSLKEGDEFYFTIDTTRPADCIVCMAYYPTPPKKISIKIIEK
jgi:hypothetical protein